MPSLCAQASVGRSIPILRWRAKQRGSTRGGGRDRKGARRRREPGERDLTALLCRGEPGSAPEQRKPRLVMVGGRGEGGRVPRGSENQCNAGMRPNPC